MQLSFDRSLAILNRHLTRDELNKGVVYAAAISIRAGEKLQFPRISIVVPEPAWLAFVDREPLANWGHSCRYVLIDRETGELRSTEARFPPFDVSKQLRWRVVYRAKGVPDSAIAIKS